jgi:hypothetical protein
MPVAPAPWPPTSRRRLRRCRNSSPKADTGARQARRGAAGLTIFGRRWPGRCSSSGTRRRCPFALGFGILNDTEARSLHLAFALFLAFMAWPARAAFAARPRAGLPTSCWRSPARFAGGYLLLFYGELATRPGQPTTMDIVVACAGLVLLLEATRRAVGWPMAALALLFIAYAMLGPWMPEVLQHKGASLNRLLSHLWLTTEGVYGIALGVSPARSSSTCCSARCSTAPAAATT